MANRSNSEHVRFRYGICLNDTCSKCKSKEVQQISARKDLVCAECGKPLRECPPPKSWWDKNGKYVIISVLVVIVAVLAGLFFFTDLFRGKTASDPEPEKPVIQTDSVSSKSAQADTVALDTVSKPVPQEAEKKEPANDQKTVKNKEEKASKPANPNYGTVNLGYGTYTGDLKNGKPHGFGKIKYTSQHQIVSSKDYMAFPGDVFEGEFRDGRISGSFGYWYHDGIQTAIKP